MEQDFRAILAGHAPLIALVGTRIYPSTYPQGAADPAIRYTKISDTDQPHMKGRDGLWSSIVQVDVRAATAEQALAARDVLVGLLNPYRGQKASTDFRLIQLRDDRGIQFEKTDAKSYYTISLDFDVIYRRAAA